MSALLRHMKRFAREEDGSSTIESLLWIPLLFAVLLLGLDVSLISTKQAMVMRVIQDGNRAYALGRYSGGSATTEQVQFAVESAIRGSIVSISPNARVKATIASNGTITTAVRMPASDLSSFGMLPNWDSLNVGVMLQHTKEF